MTIKRTYTERDQIFFCTFTCVNWINLFKITNFYDGIYKWFNVLTSQGHHVVGFVIMPNHLHLLLYLGDDKYVINTVLANGKRFMAYEIVKRLEALARQDILSILSARVTSDERARNKKHRVFEVSSDIKPCYNLNLVLQKLQYIHENPVTKKWQLADIPEYYEHSSARYYETNIPHDRVVITHYQNIV